MKTKSKILNYPLIVMGFVIILINGCKKDEKNDDVTPNPTPTHINVTLVNIPAGTFTMGSPVSESGRLSDETQFQVTLSSFRMSKYEITNAQYAAFLNAKRIGSDGKYAAGAYPNETLIYPSNGTYVWGLQYINNHWAPMPGCQSFPVTCVTWYGATEFATYVGGTLPTEAQWEYACRAGSTTAFNTGDCLSDAHANYEWAYPQAGCSNADTLGPGKIQAVGTYAANAFGLHDMHGNVGEWCSDWKDAYPATAQTNPTGPDTGADRVVRSGCWFLDAKSCRSATRGCCEPFISYNCIGFRIVLPQ